MNTGITIDQNTLILAVAAIVVLYILFKIASRILKLVGIFLVIAFGYYFWNGGTAEELKEMGVQTLFKEADVTKLVDTYCSDGQENSLKCDCLAKPIYQDLTSRLSAEQLQSLATNEEERIRQIRQSFRNKGSEIRACFVKEKGGAYWDKLKGAVEAANESLKKEDTQ